MAEEQKGKSADSKGRRRSGRRRYFRRKKRNVQDKGESSARSERSGRAGRDNRSGRSDRSSRSRRGSRSQSERSTDARRRGGRRRRRSQRQSEPETQGPSIVADIEEEYVAPTSVFVYSHVLRPRESGSGYEFRSDHFSGTGRRIEDFRIDLSGIIGRIIFDEEDGDEQFLRVSIRDAFATVDQELAAEAEAADDLSTTGDASSEGAVAQEEVES